METCAKDLKCAIGCFVNDRFGSSLDFLNLSSK